MFEEFLGQHSEERMKSELVLFAEPSPLTFALQLRREQGPSLHDTSQCISNSGKLAVIQEGIHPDHRARHEIECLKAQRAFAHPGKKILDDMIDVFLQRFYPLYSIVDPTELRKTHEEGKIPWILLQSICFIAVTFSHLDLIYKAGFSSRSQARKLYYDRAKALFDFNYEKSKITLVRVAILLSFNGPQMDCYWNPCSWIEIGVTVAVSLGLHRNTANVKRHPNDLGLLKRLWWTLAVRDAHCSALLGRTFRINMTQCDVDMLTPGDFLDMHEEALPCPNRGCEAAFRYQIQVAKLSCILRKILYFRFGPITETFSIDDIHQQLAAWKSNLPITLTAPLHGRFIPSVWAVQLEILFHYHTMLLHMDQPCPSGLSPPPHGIASSLNSTAIAESSALSVSSSAIKLVTQTSICAIPHEVFPGFFVAGITLYRQAQKAGDFNLAKMVRANFDNCQMIINEAQNSWDPGKWGMKIFGFLLYATDKVDNVEEIQGHTREAGSKDDQTGLDPAIPPQLQELPPLEDFTWANIEDFNENSIIDSMGEYMLLPNFFPPPFGN
ncbi:hypothetical protein FE257_012323 [Aspergillus nanangensis]|uniref:Xylanolytic transcriptional activator regulatory domain-containing protein n=1 Tax=Aspergillus nanangensis TaxID=2582783 RepID=A0AAD4GQT9_ASPNN|nr:hypothetical protein FE257_012323 [Aspergillus nanangensis]